MYATMNENPVDDAGNGTCNQSPQILKSDLTELRANIVLPIIEKVDGAGRVADPVPGVHKSLIDGCEDSSIVHNHDRGDDVLDQIGSQTAHVPAVQGRLIDLPEKAHEQDDVGDILHPARDAGRVDPGHGLRQKTLEEIQLRRLEKRKQRDGDVRIGNR